MRALLCFTALAQCRQAQAARKQQNQGTWDGHWGLVACCGHQQGVPLDAEAASIGQCS